MGRNYKDIQGEKNPNYKTGYCMDRANYSFYNSWTNMKARCLNPKHPKYHRYGGRGIKIHPDFIDISKFGEWAVQNGWVKGLTLDRIDNDGDYSPENCRWISMSQNSRKKSTTKLSIDDAETIRKRLNDGENEHELAKIYNVTHGTIWFIKNKFTHVDDMECTKRIKGN